MPICSKRNDWDVHCVKSACVSILYTGFHCFKMLIMFSLNLKVKKTQDVWATTKIFLDYFSCRFMKGGTRIRFQAWFKGKSGCLTYSYARQERWKTFDYWWGSAVPNPCADHAHYSCPWSLVKSCPEGHRPLDKHRGNIPVCESRCWRCRSSQSR